MQRLIPAVLIVVIFVLHVMVVVPLIFKAESGHVNRLIQESALTRCIGHGQRTTLSQRVDEIIEKAHARQDIALLITGLCIVFVVCVMPSNSQAKRSR